MLPTIEKATAREAAWIAIANSDHEFIHDTLEKWEGDPQQRPFIMELASGTVRRKLTLNYWLKTVAKGKQKRTETALLHMTLYQIIYMDKVPAYAAIDESVNLAKRYIHPVFGRFVNATMRRLAEEIPALPNDLSIQYSFPNWFINQLPQDRVEPILEALNRPPRLMARERSIPFKMRHLDKPIPSKEYYIQNCTPAEQIEKALELVKPKTILDLCAAPGGKAIAAHDLFPDAKLTVNDRTEEKVARLKENLTFYDVPAKVTVGLGETFTSDTKYDLVILDVPCSNTGVLNKRPEARWRLSEETLRELEATQRALIANGLKLLSKGGALLYMTCSILPRENEYQMEKIPLKKGYMETIYPSDDGHDGGFAALVYDA